MDAISPKYQMTLVRRISEAIWAEYSSYAEALYYIKKWHEHNDDWNNPWENFSIFFKDQNQQKIDLQATLHNIDGDTLLKMAIDLGLETPNFIPAIPIFRNEIKSDYSTACTAFEKAFRCVENDPATAVGLVNSALKNILHKLKLHRNKVTIRTICLFSDYKIMKVWKICRLGDVVRFNPIERLSKEVIAKKVPMECLQPYTRMVSSYEISLYSGGSKFRNEDTLMARITPCLENGKTAYVSILDEGEIGFGSTEYIVFRNIKGVTDSKFIYYFVTNPWFRDIAIKSMVGSSGRQRVQQSVLENLEVSLPSLGEQKRIANILGAFDDKIELNRRINDNLAS